jgi:hypothetical protein
VVLMAASVDAATSLHRAIGGALAPLGGAAISAEFAWLCVAAVTSTGVALRLGIEMRRSKGAVAMLVSALTFYAIAAAVQLAWLPLVGDLALHAGVTATLLAQGLIWTTSLVYARYVYLDAQGLLVSKPPRAKESQPAKSAEGKKADDKTTADPSPTVAAKQVRIDAPHTPSPAAKPAGGPLKAAMISAATNRSPAESPANETDRRMSKAERKRLRKQGRLDSDDDE